MEKKKIAIFASGNGTNAENIIRTFRAGNRVDVTCVVSNVRESGVLARAVALHVPSIYISNQELAEAPQELIQELRKQGVDLIVLAGFMRKIPEAMIEAFEDRIINIHPSLLPAYGGKGMWGHHVHEAVIAAGEPQSGVTVHYVNNIMDGGRIIMQEAIDLVPGETPATLEAKIHQIEYSMYPRAIVVALEEIAQRQAYTERSDEVATTEFEEQAEASVTPVAVPPHITAQTPPPLTPDQQWAEALHINFVPPTQQQQQQQQQQPQQQPTFQQVPQDPEQPAKPPRNYLVWAILATIICCVPLGIVAIVFSAQVKSKFFRGDYEGAKRASERAQLWIILAFVLGMIWQTIYTPLSMLLEVFSPANIVM